MPYKSEKFKTQKKYESRKFKDGVSALYTDR